MAWIQAPVGTEGWCAAKYEGKIFITPPPVSVVTNIVSPDLVIRKTPAGERIDTYGLAPGTRVSVLEVKTLNSNIWYRVRVITGVAPPPDEIPPEEKSDAEKCFAAGKYWYDSACHDKPKPKIEWKKILPPVLIGVGIFAVLWGWLRSK